MDVSGRAVITGASAGIGEAVARRLAAAGFDLLLVARRAERLEALAADLRTKHGRDVKVLGLDVAREDAAQEMLAAAPDATVLVNNAGVGRFGPALSIPAEEQAQEVRLNCESLTRLTLAFLPGFVARRRGVVLNLASIAAFQPVPYFAVYAATKAYVLSLSEALDVEVRGQGVRVVAVCPGPVPTEFQSIAGSPDAHHTPRLARRTPEEVAEVCLKAIRRPRPVAIPAPFHTIMWWFQRFLPRRTVARMAGDAMKKRLAGQGAAPG
ncbi:MAG: SDR family oxidoreductase [Planctomycetes bacterium]|nr:SDR family oxidoreductase [Planctomycetota bacterium]